MTLITTPQAWSNEQQRWSRFYAGRLPEQLRAAAARIDATPPEALQSHFDTFLSLLNATGGRAELAPLWLALVARLHPLPVRWGQWAAWLAILRQAALKAKALNQPARQAEYLAYEADLLLNVGRLAPALDTARQALALGRRNGAAWPLAVAGNAASATLRSLARYDEAQAIIDEIRADLARMERPRPAARAAMAIALLDLEEMDLLRYFKRLDDALALGESLIARLAAVEGVDPHDLAMVYLRRATIVWVSGRYQAAAEDLRRSAKLYRAAGNSLQAVFAGGNLGVVYYSMSRYVEAEALMLAAIRAAEETNARYRLVSDLGDLSVVYIALGRMDLAYDYTDRMVRLAGELGNTAELSRGRGNRGYALLGLGRYEEALPDIEFSLDLYRQQGRIEGILVTTIDLIIYLRGIGDEEQAARVAEENYAAARRESYPHLHIVTARCLALFPPAERQRTLLEEALALAREHERPLDEAGCLFSLAGLAEDATARNALYGEGVRLLQQMGATGWLAGKSPANPPLLPMTI